MDWLERELKSALSRQAPPADFAARVLRRTERPVYRFPRWLAAAAAVIVLAGAGMGYRQYRGEMAKEQLLEAFKIASVKVNRIQTQVQGVGQ
ncbi:MAG TPA: hypothetical protein VHW09_19040 [Bryobacteraceae bacterium]|jgi:hypothetical protein|nr:hypothetical protein [Bryobacteraceae bacterium]